MYYSSVHRFIWSIPYFDRQSCSCIFTQVLCLSLHYDIVRLDNQQLLKLFFGLFGFFFFTSSSMIIIVVSIFNSVIFTIIFITFNFSLFFLLLFFLGDHLYSQQCEPRSPPAFCLNYNSGLCSSAIRQGTNLAN